MTLSEYIRSVGPAEFARKVGISERAATAYMYGARRPKPEIAIKIVSKTPVDWDGVYGNSKKRKTN